MPLKIIFLGSDSFAVPALSALHTSPHEVSLCVTQPDRPQGRGRHIQPCPVRRCALELGIPTLTPEKIGDAVDALAAIRPDLAVVTAYGQYLPKAILAVPRFGFINIHPSLLPAYRGAAPMQWAIADGLAETGVTIQQVVSRMDAGPVLAQQTAPLLASETLVDVEPRLAAIGAAMLLDVIAQIEQGTAQPREQDESAVTWARKLQKEDARMDWTMPARTLHNRVRGFQPWPGTFAMLGEGRLRILRTQVEEGSGLPGAFLERTGLGPLIACGEGALRLIEVQPEGKRAMTGADFLRGSHLPDDARLV
ncbi:MAG: methionyl-tRNA formyltransferase [Kiritimatiellae bacterium]|nr:methionyl-tRNA formyltransferase [Kiritimatiellia bacterium]MCO5067583.1 methionyl-tRNA formyltransferase [Kiritimatiellia bacterium]